MHRILGSIVSCAERQTWPPEADTQHIWLGLRRVPRDGFVRRGLNMSGALGSGGFRVDAGLVPFQSNQPVKKYETCVGSSFESLAVASFCKNHRSLQLTLPSGLGGSWEGDGGKTTRDMWNVRTRDPFGLKVFVLT